MSKAKILLTVTNDLNFDQRMIRICSSLSAAGYEVTLIGREWDDSKPLTEKPFAQKRLFIKPKQGKMLYFLYWIKLFFYLLFKKADLICAIDLDTILPVYFASFFKRTKKVYDAHELFTEMKEVIKKPLEKKIWDGIEKFAVPRFPLGYTIGDFYAAYFKEKYNVDYKVVRNATVLKPLIKRAAEQKYILYQGWVNEGRCFEELIPAMQYIDMNLIVCGEGNFFEQAKALTIKYNVTDKVKFMGYLPPAELKTYTEAAFIGITLFHGISKSNVLSMANRFFDYMHHGVPQICMQFPEYEKVNKEFEIAVLIPDPPSPEKIAHAINDLIQNPVRYNELSKNCLAAREQYCWQNEEKSLLAFYKSIFPL